VLDYAKAKGEVIVKSREAMLYNALQRPGLSRDDALRPDVQHIVLKNGDEVKAIFARLLRAYD
jgi:hypothetical protein